MFIESSVQSTISNIYKYLPLNKNLDHIEFLTSMSTCQFCYQNLDLDEKRIYNLLHNELWFSKYSILNDPYEMQGFSYYKNKNEGPGACQDLNNEINRNSVAVASFCMEMNNLPLWAHYANSHQGYCLEYKVVSPKYLFPVKYQDERVEQYVFSLISAKSDEDKRLMGIQLSTKARSWQYEEELRIIYCHTDFIKENGVLVNYNDIELKVNKIIIGANCNKQNKMILKSVAEKLGISCSQAYLSNKKYEIFEKNI